VITAQPAVQHSLHSATLADILERVLDKGIVIAGDIRIKLVDVELLTIQIRLMIASVDKARELGIDWWAHDRSLTSQAPADTVPSSDDNLERRVARLEAEMATGEQGGKRSHRRGKAPRK
jgi:hypothetical protein